MEIIRKDGEIRNIRVLIKEVLWEGKKQDQIISFDITEQKKTEEKLSQSYEKLQKTVDSTIQAIASIVETRDPYTAGHQKRVARLASAIAEELGLPKEKITELYVAGILHDIGKVNVPAEILSKPGKLSETEMNLIKIHPQVGKDLLKSLELPWEICPVVLQHHERIDGSGYPDHLKGNKIRIEAKIIAVADTVEAMASHRTYRPTLGIDRALDEIIKNRGLLYDPDAVDACVRLFKEKNFTFE
jgi:putative nucleotidyltransferase with HDIG domain